MKHLSEVAHILNAAIDGEPQKAIAYAELLASKLAEDGEVRQANILRSIVNGIPQPRVFPTGVREGESDE